MQVKNYFLPINLDHEAIRQSCRLEYAEKLLFVISCISYRRNNRRNLTPDLYVEIGAEFLGGFIRKNDVKRVKEDLEKRGIIETDGRYIVGTQYIRGKCIGFRLTKQYRYEVLHAVPALKPKKEMTSVKSMEEANINQTNIMKYLENCLKRVTIEPAALDALESRFERDIKEAEVKVRELVDSRNNGFMSYYSIKEQDWFFNRDEKTGRVFHNVANLNRELRPFLRLDGRELVEIDISNCQPMLLHTLYPADSAEAPRWKETVESGTLYEVLMAATGQDREITKKRFLSAAFGHNEHSNKVKKALELIFPEMAALISNAKVETYNALAIAMQKLEADLIIDKVVGLCVERNIPAAVTIHDSISTFPECRAEVTALIKEECEKLYGLIPNVKQN